MQQDPQPGPHSTPPTQRSGFEGEGQRSGRRFMFGVRLLFLALLVSVAILTVASTRANPEFGFNSTSGWVVFATAGVGIVVLILDSITPHKRLSNVVGIYIGISVGLVAAVAFGSLIDTVTGAWELKSRPDITSYVTLGKVIIGLIICYTTVSVVINTKDDFRLVIPYVEFARQRRGIRPLLLDSSALIDGRIAELGSCEIIDAPLVIPRFVVDELQALADSSDRTKRARGRRGLDLVAALQENPHFEVRLEEIAAGETPVDRKLLDVAAAEGMRVVTTDANLQKVGRIHGVTVINLNEIGAAMRAGVAPGDALTVAIVKAGENPGQGVGFLPDGTMIVVDEAAARIGETLPVTVTNTLQTGAGRLVFARHEPRTADGAPSLAGQMAEAATSQPRATMRPPSRGDASPHGRNPRR